VLAVARFQGPNSDCRASGNHELTATCFLLQHILVILAKASFARLAGPWLSQRRVVIRWLLKRTAYWCLSDLHSVIRRTPLGPVSNGCFKQAESIDHDGRWPTVSRPLLMFAVVVRSFFRTPSGGTFMHWLSMAWIRDCELLSSAISQSFHP